MSNTPVASRRAGIGRIPPEILGEIFIRCPPHSPLRISSVCRLWRTLALATPALWASLDIKCDIAVSRPPLRVIQTHLQRSGTHPLSFILYAIDVRYFHNEDPHLVPILTTLAAARWRWYNVDITLTRMTQDILDLITQGDAPLLQSIRCDVTQANLSIPLHMLHCPRLESFHWYSFGSLLKFLPPVDISLTSLSIGTILSGSECISLLRLCPRLSSANFYSVCSSDPSPAPHFIHPTLSTLTLTGEHFGMLLAALTLPALLDLNLTIREIITSLPTGWVTALSAFFERSNFTLRHLSLSITHKGGLEPVLLHILALTPHLHSLKLSDCRQDQDSLPFSAVLVHALNPPPPPGVPLCPRLQKLVLSRVLGCPDGVCTAMFRARRGTQAQANGVACLEWANIELSAMMSATVTRRT
ncbi:hypothetical protein BD779DRAFT_1144646 [Infundibulicybe gibba]|nr:hypothetical protein BD779DRAFT_1144646 [Infundibulicybe gibba]